MTNSEYTRVTDILKPFNGLQGIDPAVLQAAAERGDTVHKIIEGKLLGIEPINMPHPVVNYIASFDVWVNEHPINAIKQEIRLYDDELMITGQIDLIDKLDDGVAIIDFKTSSKPSKTWALQLSAYAYLARKAGFDVKKIGVLHLSKFGKTAKFYEYQECWDLFKKCYDLYHYFKENV